MRFAILSKKVALAFQALVMAFGFGVFGLVATSGTAQAACTEGAYTLQNGADCSQANGTRAELFGAGGIFTTIANVLIFLVGAISVLFLIIGGLRYVISQGDSKNVEAAKNTILYAVIGVIVAIVSYALINFVINALLAQP